MKKKKELVICLKIIIIALVMLSSAMYIFFKDNTNTKNGVFEKDENSESTKWRNYNNDQLLGLVKNQIDSEIFFTYNFLGLEDNYLILDNGTAPYPRGLSIFDLNTEQLVYSDQYSEPLIISNSTVSYWSPVDKKVSESNCPKLIDWEAYGFDVGIESYVTIHLNNLSKNYSGEYRCEPRQ
jgi:hypothetical protein